MKLDPRDRLTTEELLRDERFKLDQQQLFPLAASSKASPATSKSKGDCASFMLPILCIPRGFVAVLNSKSLES